MLACLCQSPSFAQSGEIQAAEGRYRKAIRSLLKDEQGRFLSAGEDGFLGIWNSEAAIERFQLSRFALGSMVLRPGKTEISFVESDEFGSYRISAWNYETKKNLFSLRFMDSVSFLNYSAEGNFLIAGLDGQTGIIFVDPDTGVIFGPLAELPDGIAFAATSRSERTMISYSSQGAISYWDLETGNELYRFEAPPYIRSLVLFGNNCFMGGFDPGGLLILDAATGTVLARDNSINGSIFIDDPEHIDAQGAAQLFCLSSAGSSAGFTSTILRMEIRPSGRLNTLGRIAIPPGIPEISSVASAGMDNFILGSANGSVWLWNGGLARLLYSKNPEQILDIAASSEAIGFVSADGMAGFLPLDYSLLKNSDELKLEDVSVPSGSGAYSHISADPSAPMGTGKSWFLLWQNNRSIPILRALHSPPLAAAGSRDLLDKLPLNYPIRAVSIFGNSILCLNSQGTVSVLKAEDGSLSFTYSAAGAQDAVFIDSNTIFIGRSAVTGNTPFLTVNSLTGETVPLAYPAMLGLRVHRGSGGAIYGAVVNRIAGEIQTSIVKLNTSNPSLSEKLAEYNGEDSAFFLAESGGIPVSNLGSGAASLYGQTRTASGNQALERSAGLPQKAVDGGGRIIVLDGEGNICWHDNRTGNLLAVFSLYQAYWTLETEGASISGAVVIQRLITD